MNCPQCNDSDVSLFTYFQNEDDTYEATFDCRACRNSFIATISEKELNEYK